MRKAVIIKISFPEIAVIDGEIDRKELEDKFNILINFTLKPFIQPHGMELRCYVEYPPNLTERIDELVAKEGFKEGNIVFTPNPERSIRTHAVKDRIIADVDEMKFKDDEIIYFMRLNYNMVCKEEVFKELSEYVPEDEIRVLLFGNNESYRLSDGSTEPISDELIAGCICICSGWEYRLYFRLYDYFYPKKMEEKARLIPHRYIFNRMITMIEE
ncbi:MAG: hypothetical protein ACRC1P_00615 [Cellulosilyticaceae bacterium]